MIILINAGLILLVLAACVVLAFLILGNQIKRQREEQFRFEQEHS